MCCCSLSYFLASTFAFLASERYLFSIAVKSAILVIGFFSSLSCWASCVKYLCFPSCELIPLVLIVRTLLILNLGLLRIQSSIVYCVGAGFYCDVLTSKLYCEGFSCCFPGESSHPSSSASASSSLVQIPAIVFSPRGGTERSGHSQTGWNYFCGGQWLLEEIKWFKGLCICAGRRDLRGHWWEDRRMLGGIVQPVLLSPIPDLSACWGGKAGLAGGLRGGGRT